MTGDRINKAFAQGGGAPLLKALAELGFRAGSVLCLRRAASEAALAGISVTVPVSEPLDFWYPLTPTCRIEDGRIEVSAAEAHGTSPDTTRQNPGIPGHALQPANDLLYADQQAAGDPGGTCREVGN
ncbi:hypothetical protein EN745_27630 [Mesorhizobium sp. M4A.F.Ca.ET.022.05.2.1]|uniref:hypothetical protein n=1 Tax=Mesorhizobium sp. M4A.F.Ca.ET.022.05.2.1 TaxID=2496653 RepID=UPI000FCA862F|nr:hypothetical protein [Mesorhizobium sp. M4A.F.Ca.ET.022.05.2.1]RVC75379.1 hypothetical protein EN745_27630 [Mesorhizobium sp. M4A.F.Ca.ET.022.05.2.1]